MRIDRLLVENFKGFERREFAFHPQFNLVVGENGSGKSSVLDALAVAAGCWLRVIPGYGNRTIKPDEMRLIGFESGLGINWERQTPCIVQVTGSVQDQDIFWQRSIETNLKLTNKNLVAAMRKIAEQTVVEVRRGSPVILPLIGYYGTGRLSNVTRDQARIRSVELLAGQRVSRLDGYTGCVDPRLSIEGLITLIARQSWIAFQQDGKDTPAFAAVRAALTKNVHGAKNIVFDAKLGEVVACFDDLNRQPFNNLSDGQRCMLALVGDIAYRAATLNPHLEANVLTETPGIVLIDELDLHLHPKWQRHVIEDLRTTFPKIQFICTTHSPFLIQSLRSSEELVMLDGQSTANLGNEPIQTIAHDIQGVENTETSARYDEMKSVARDYLEILEDAAMAPEDKLEQYKRRLAESIAPYADNPAFQAFLEMKRTVKLGE